MSSEAERSQEAGNDTATEALVKDVSEMEINKESQEFHDTLTGSIAENESSADHRDNPHPQVDDENSDYETPTEGDEEELLDDLVDEEKLQELEASFSVEQLAVGDK